MRQQTIGWSFMVIVGLQLVLPALALPNPLEVVGRKFAAKPNDKKKVTTETNEITVLLAI